MSSSALGPRTAPSAPKRSCSRWLLEGGLRSRGLLTARRPSRVRRPAAHHGACGPEPAMRSRRWRSGLVGPPGPGRGCPEPVKPVLLTDIGVCMSQHVTQRTTILVCGILCAGQTVRYYSGRIGLGLHRTTWAALRSIGSSRDSTKGLAGARRGPDLVGPGRLTCYPIGTTASGDPRGFSTGPLLGRLPEQGHPPPDPPGYATLRESGPEQRLGALETRKWTDAGRPRGAMGT
jgi:hypothetical protein